MAMRSPTTPAGPPPAQDAHQPHRAPGALIGMVAGAAGLAALNLLVTADVGGPLRALVGFPVAVLLPGALALRATGLDRVTGWTWLLRAVSLSIAGLMAVSLSLALLPGVALSAAGSLVGLDLLVGILAVAAAARGLSWFDEPRAGAEPDGPVAPSTVDPDRTVPTADSSVDSTVDPGPAGRNAAAGDAGRSPRRTGRVATRPREPRRGTVRLAAAALLPGAVAVCLAVAGAARLDAGGSAALTIAALVCAAVAVVPTAAAARRPGGDRIAGAGLYLLGLAVLLATSLRGDGVTGHDIKIEYRVFLDTFNTGSWGPGGANVSYNSCLSITVLPAFLARLLGLAPLDVFAVCFPLLFALVPVAVFQIARRVLPTARALVAGVLFVAFPTFVNDMTMLNRQQVGTLFFAVIVLTLLDERPSRRRSWLLVVLTVGLTVSHYTTTYVAAALLLLAWTLPTAPALLRRRPTVTRTGLGAAGALLVVLAVEWSLLTGTDEVLTTTIREAALAVGSKANVKSEATAYSLVGGSRRLTDQEVLDAYLDGLRTKNAERQTSPAGPHCLPRLLPADVLPDTRAGAVLTGVGVDPGRANSLLRTAAVVLYQGGAAVGAVLFWWLAWRHRRRRAREPDRLVLAALATASLLLLAGTVVAPQLSDDYGPLRLFQQALVVLAAGVVLAVATAFRWLRSVAVDRIVVGIAVGCLLTTSGVLPQLTGGYAPQLNLNNAGSYFRAYYAQTSDLSSSGWIDDNLDHTLVLVADSRDSANLLGLTRVKARTGLAPGVVPVAEPVVVTSADGWSAVATAVAGDRVLRYEFPLDCVAAGRPLLHVEGAHRIYGPVGAG